MLPAFPSPFAKSTEDRLTELLGGAFDLTFKFGTSMLRMRCSAGRDQDRAGYDRAEVENQLYLLDLCTGGRALHVSAQRLVLRVGAKVK